MRDAVPGCNEPVATVGSPPLTKILEPQVVQTVLECLFPGGKVEAPREDILPIDWSPDLAVTEGEIRGAQSHVRSGCDAPGLDGITNSIFGAAFHPLRARFQECYTRFSRRAGFYLCRNAPV